MLLVDNMHKVDKDGEGVGGQQERFKEGGKRGKTGDGHTGYRVPVAGHARAATLTCTTCPCLGGLRPSWFWRLKSFTAAKPKACPCVGRDSTT